MSVRTGAKSGFAGLDAPDSGAIVEKRSVSRSRRRRFLFE
jgi:hypothetical protein